MRINLINPNTCQGMTDKIVAMARSIALNETQVTGVSPLHGPLSIECALDETIASAALLDIVAQKEREGADAHIIACFGDPGIDAARELASVPVIGIAGAAFQLASLVSYRFGIVTTMSRTLPASEHLLDRYGCRHLCSGLRATDIPVLELEETGEHVYRQLRSECELAIRQDGAEAIVLGCAGMSDLGERLMREFEIPVIDGVAAAVKLAESLYQLGLTTSKTGMYAPPLKKDFLGRYQHWSQ